jgi:hypothetical protein
LRYGIGGISKLKREKIEQIAGVKIFEENRNGGPEANDPEPVIHELN